MGGRVQGQAGKLTWAGQAWASGRLRPGSVNPVLEDAALWGIDPTLLGLGENEDGVWECHADALHAFLRIDGQWRVLTVGDRLLWLGLDYGAARAGLELADVSLTPQQWAEVQVIERGALEALNRK